MRNDLDLGCHSIDEDAPVSSWRLDTLFILVCILGVCLAVAAGVGFNVWMAFKTMFQG